MTWAAARSQDDQRRSQMSCNGPYILVSTLPWTQLDPSGAVTPVGLSFHTPSNVMRNSGEPPGVTSVKLRKATWTSFYVP